MHRFNDVDLRQCFVDLIRRYSCDTVLGGTISAEGDVYLLQESCITLLEMRECEHAGVASARFVFIAV